MSEESREVRKEENQEMPKSQNQNMFLKAAVTEKGQMLLRIQV